jgi:hypothetical protein
VLYLDIRIVKSSSSSPTSSREPTFKRVAKWGKILPFEIRYLTVVSVAGVISSRKAAVVDLKKGHVEMNPPDYQTEKELSAK